MGNPVYKIYLNNLYFCRLASSDEYGDRPEPYREHERNLWILHQIMRFANHELVVTNEEKTILRRITSRNELLNWFQEAYPSFVAQLDLPHYTRHPHPNDMLEK